MTASGTQLSLAVAAGLIGYNGVDGINDMEGKVARVATSKLGNERVSIEERDCRDRR
jgi:hypothetical protein